MNNVYNHKKRVNISNVESRTHYLVNQYRIKNNRKPLYHDKKLAYIARKHSKDMGIKNYFSHVNKQGETLEDRIGKINYVYTKSIGMAENIHMNYLYSSYTIRNGVKQLQGWKDAKKLAKEAVNGWIKSPGHRTNLLSRTYGKEGIGVAIITVFPKVPKK